MGGKDTWPIDPSDGNRVAAKLMDAVPHYFFDLYNDLETVDEEGRECADLGAMRANALREVREMMTDSVRQGHLNLNHYIEVREETGKVIYILTFDDALNVTPLTGKA